MRNLNAITPETETSSHYFWAQAHDFDAGNPKMTHTVFQQAEIAFLEDKVVFEAQQRMIDADTSESQVDIHADAGGIQARRILSRLHDDEQAMRRAAE